MLEIGSTVVQQIFSVLYCSICFDCSHSIETIHSDAHRNTHSLPFILSDYLSPLSTATAAPSASTSAPIIKEQPSAIINTDTASVLQFYFFSSFSFSLIRQFDDDAAVAYVLSMMRSQSSTRQ